MHKGTTTIERAFQIARSGQCTTVEEIKRLLSREGFNQDVVSGRLLRKQLQQLMLAAMAPTDLQHSTRRSQETSEAGA